MATYPTTLVQLVGTVVTPVSGKTLLQSVSGKFRVRDHFSQERQTVTIKHYLTQAELDTLKAFYTANEKIAWDFVYQVDGSTWECIFSDAIRPVPQGGGYYDVTVSAVVT